LSTLLEEGAEIATERTMVQGLAKQRKRAVVARDARRGWFVYAFLKVCRKRGRERFQAGMNSY
jgi:hypothetical protein